MLDVGDDVPDFTLPKAGGEVYNDIGSFTLSAALADGPVVLAFFPAAFTSGCTAEMCTFRDSMHRFDELDAQVYGVSVDLPTAQNVWILREDLNFPMLSDWDHELIHDFGVVLPDMYGEFEAAKRSIFVIDADGRITYRWVEAEGETDFDAVVDSVQEAVADIAAD
ncbi:peroxiredoxin [Haloarcula onubensis]|uniref:Peroxiredoxin n=1 Tax=Haloarcula onubensis TaxID=2950539 RepID=A0ABU2FQZ0_9EURY|nr:peroxiredoxin [Halomicroarcula sp. S3CR25-11]MDS0283185.1 peroxiredoxin [Halomicroarcula sp. S3CR25-11]